MIDSLLAAWAELGRPRIAAGMASLMLATTVGLLWRGGLMDDPLGQATPESDATHAAGAPYDEALQTPAPVAPAPTPPAPAVGPTPPATANPAQSRSPAPAPAAPAQAPAAPTAAPAAPVTATAPATAPAPAPAPARLAEAAARAVTDQAETLAQPPAGAARAGIAPPAERKAELATLRPGPEVPPSQARSESATPPAVLTRPAAVAPRATARAGAPAFPATVQTDAAANSDMAMPGAAEGPASAKAGAQPSPSPVPVDRGRAALPAPAIEAMLDELLARLAANPERWTVRPGAQPPQAASEALQAWLRLLRRETGLAAALGASARDAEPAADSLADAPDWSLELLDDSRAMHRFRPTGGGLVWERSAPSQTLVVPLTKQAIRQLGRTPPVGPSSR